MIFFKHSLITITILVIAISVMPAIADVVDARSMNYLLLLNDCIFIIFIVFMYNIIKLFRTYLLSDTNYNYNFLDQ